MIDENTVDVVVKNQLEQDLVLQVKQYFSDKYEAQTEIGVVSNIVKKELIKNAIISLILASIGTIIYISLRFKFSYAISAIIALLHDVLIVIVIFGFLRFEVSTIFIAAILSIVGYSINDTIVGFDRIRENIKGKKLKKEDDLKEAINLSLNQTVGRSIVTSITTLIPVISLILIGSHEIFNFNIAMLVGLVAGTYSSIFIASQLLFLLERKNIGKPEKKKWYLEDDSVQEKKVKGVNS